MVLFEKLLETEIAKIDPVEINTAISRKPKFGWGNSSELRKVIETYGEEHFPLVWSVPRQDSTSVFPGLFQRTVELNLCTLETNEELLNTVRVDPTHSYQGVLLPLWKSILRQLDLSGTITVDEESIQWQLFPNYKVGDERETQEIWDVLKITFTAHFNNEYTPCCQ